MTETLKVLVTDDEPGMRMAVSRALRNFQVHLTDFDEDVDFEVDQAESGEEALEKIAVSAPNILLLDHKMQGMSGLDVLKQLQESRHEDMLTIMITAYASIEAAVTATKSGAYDFLAKPFTPSELKDTIRKAAEHLMVARQARKLAQERRQVRFQFIRVLGHELKSPLGAIEGYLNIMQNHSLGERLESYNEMIGRSMVRIAGMRKLIVDLLDLTRIESGQKVRQIEPVDVRQSAQLCIENAVPDAMAREIEIELHSPGTVKMNGDRGEIEIVLNNLISNAVKYNRDGGRVDVTLKDEKDNVVIQVADTGIGMSEKEREKLFGEFVRIKNEKTKNILGSGLGLSIVKKLAHMYGGSASVESEPDAGTTFTVVLSKNPEVKDDHGETSRNPELAARE